MKNVFVNATALRGGGGLITLVQFLDNIPVNDEALYYIFLSADDLAQKYTQNNIKFIFSQYKKGIARVYWDHFGLKKWAKIHHIVPNLIISLQNTPVSFDKKTPQIVYIMQAIPFVDIKWNIFKKDERILWFYKNIYPLFMRLGLRKKFTVVTQSKWIKNEFAKKFNFPLENIRPIRPIINITSDVSEENLSKDKYNIFCPSSPFSYKNNIEIANALIFLKSTGEDISKIKIYITFGEKDDSRLNKKIDKYNLQKNFHFLGRIHYDKMLSLYKSCDLVVFPSYLETFGLPLLEAAFFGKPILCANEAYSKEIIQNYAGAKLLNKHSPKEWGEHLLQELNAKKDYPKFQANFQESWKDFFVLVTKLLNGK